MILGIGMLAKLHHGYTCKICDVNYSEPHISVKISDILFLRYSCESIHW